MQLLLRLLLAPVCLVIAATTGYCAHAAAANSVSAAAARPALTVTTVQPQRIDLPLKLAAHGAVAAWQEAIVGAQVNGLRLSEVRVNVGDRVRRGQLLASFADDSVRAELAQQRAAVAEAEAALAEANADAARAQSVQGTGAMSEQQISQYLTTARTAAARLAAARAVADGTQVRLRYTRVVAPDHGVISARTATVGAVSQPGQELFRLIRRNRLEWRAELTSAELDRIAIGQAVAVTTPSGRTVAGRVRMVAPTMDPQTRLALVYVDLINNASDPQFPAKAGMYVKGEFALGASGALTAPVQAVVVRDGFNYVFEVRSDRRVARRKVTVGRRVADRAEILSGITEATRIVASGAAFLNDGDLVAVSGDAAPAGAPGK